MSVAARNVECLINARPPLSDRDLKRISAEQRTSNARAIRLSVQENASRIVIVSRALQRMVEFADGDAAAVSSGLDAIERLTILIDYAGLSDIALERAQRWLGEAGSALMRFQMPEGAPA